MKIVEWRVPVERVVRLAWQMILLLGIARGWAGAYGLEITAWEVGGDS